MIPKLGKRLPALLMLAIMVSMPVTVLAYGLDEGWSPLRGGAIEPEGWRGGPLEDLIQDSMEGDDSLLRMLDHVGAMPESAKVPVQSHVLGLAVPPQALPALYEAEALSSASPLREAILAYNAGLDLMDADELLASADLRTADDLPFDAQVAIAVLLYAIIDASLLQKQAVSGLSGEDYTALMGLPGMILAGRLDPTDGSEEADEDFAAAYGLLSQVDKQRIDEAALVMVHAVSHAMPSLREWGERERAAAEDPRIDDIASLLDPYAPERVESMEPSERLDILADALRTASALQGVDIHPGLHPLPAPRGDAPLRSAILDLAQVVGDVDETLLELELQRADALPPSLQEAAARIVTNQAALLRASLAFQEAAADLEAGTLADPESLLEADQRALLAALGDMRRAEVRTVLAVQESAPTLEAWGLVWSREPSMLPASPADAAGKLTDAAALGAGMANPETGLQQVMRLAAHAQGSRTDAAAEPPLPPSGALGDAVLQLYTRYGIEVDDRTRDDVARGADMLPPTVERNTARILLAQLDALGELEDLQASLTDEDRAALADGARVEQRLLVGEVSARDVQALRAHHEVRDRIEGTYLGAATRVAAAIDASSAELSAYADEISGLAPLAPPSEPTEPAEPKSKPWYAKAWSVVSSIQVIGTASAQSVPGEPITHPTPACPASPLADCGNDVWFMDPLLETVVVSGFGETDFHPDKMGTHQDLTSTGDNQTDGVYPRGQMLTLDMGGDDEYRNNAGGASPAFTTPAVTGSAVTGPAVNPQSTWFFFHPTAVAVALDLNGNDRYHRPPAGGFPSDNMLYGSGLSQNISAPGGVQGAGVGGGMGFLWDRRGDDKYDADQMAQGFGSGIGREPGDPSSYSITWLPYGLGILVDGDGDDLYKAESNAQGASRGQILTFQTGVQTWGLGVLVDAAGSDAYTLTGVTGEDTVGQGGALRQGVGILVDGGGNDVYDGGQQGSGNNLGILIDMAGDDAYTREPGETFTNDRCWTGVRVLQGDALNDQQGFLTNASNPTPNGRGVFVDLRDGTCRQDDSIQPDIPDIERFVGENTKDTDDDGYTDAVEEVAGTDATNATDYPAGVPREAPESWPDGLEYPPGGLELPRGSDHLVRVPGIFVLGDAVATTYPQSCDDKVLVEGGIQVVVTVQSTTIEGCDYLASLDIGGDDTYKNRAGSGPDLTFNGNNPNRLPGLAVDVAGDDHYDGGDACTQGCDGVLIDLRGNDTYVTQEGQGVSTTLALDGVLFDAAGNDTYTITDGSNALAQGSVGSGGLLTVGDGGLAAGLFIDATGDDVYDSPVQAVAKPGTLALSVSPSLALFADLGGQDTYQPVGRQGHSSTGGMLAIFVDAGGADAYVGTPDNRGSPDFSDHRNNRLHASTGVRFTSSTSLFMDVERDDASTLPFRGLDPESPAHGSTFRAASLGISVGTAGPDTLLDDYALHIDPGGDDTYHNNAGSTLFRGARHAVANETASVQGGAQVTTESTYDVDENYPIAALLIDLDGNDRYIPDDAAAPHDPQLMPSHRLRGVLSQGAGFLGVGILVDEADGAADDTYVARAMSQGFSLYGWGILWDRAGDDAYRHDPALVRRPTVDAGLAAWLEFDLSQDDLREQAAGSDVQEAWSSTVAESSVVPYDPAWGALGTWTIKARDPDWPSGLVCVVVPDSDRGAAHGPAVSGNRVAFSVFDETHGLWRLISVDVEPSDGQCPHDDELKRRWVAAHDGEINSAHSPRSNQVHARFASFDGESRIVWQDDRDGTWSLYQKSVDAASDARALILGRDDQLEGHKPSTSNQVNPDAHGSRIVYQDDRGCDGGEWSIFLYKAETDNETMLAECGMHVKPRVSDRLVVWQTRGADGDWDVVVHDGTGMRNVTANRTGDQYEPDVAGSRVLYTESADGGPRVVRYEYDRDPAKDEHVVERADAIHASLDRAGQGKAVWVDTTGVPASSLPVGSDAWEVHARIVGRQNPDPGDGGVRLSMRSAATADWMQGASYANGRGILLDEAGLDTYRGDRFAQGAAADLVGPTGAAVPPENLGVGYGPFDAYGALVDADGNDVYAARETSQGVHYARQITGYAFTPGSPPNGVPQHDVVGFEATAGGGLLLDLRGNDRYDANTQSQGYGALNLGGGISQGSCLILASPLPPTGFECWYPIAMLDQSYGLFMDLGGMDAYCYGTDCEAAEIQVQVPITADTCASLDAQVLQPLGSALAGHNDTVRQEISSPTFNDTFNDTFERPLWSFLEEDWPDDSGARSGLNKSLNRTVWSILEEQWPEYPPQGADDLRQILEENLDTTVWSVVAEQWPESPPEGVEESDWEALRSTLEQELDRSVWSVMEEYWPEDPPEAVEDLKETLAQNLAQNPWSPADDAWPDHRDEAEAALNHTIFQALEENVSFLLGELMDQCATIEDLATERRDDVEETLTGEPRPPRQDRNDEVWLQGPLGGGPVQPLLVGVALHPGGVGMDLPLMDNINGALKKAADEIIELTMKVHATAQGSEVADGTFQDQVNLTANVEFQEDAPPGFQFNHAEYFIDGAFVGYDEDKTDVGDRTVFNRTWDTSEDQDGEYDVAVRVHYRHEQSAFTLGYKQNATTVEVDNPTRILAAPEIPFVRDDITKKPLVAFSPFPHASNAPGHANATFRIPPDLNRTGNGHDGWVRIDVYGSTPGGAINETDHVHTVFNGTAAPDENITRVWNGTRIQNGSYEAVPSGTYHIRLSATDRNATTSPVEAGKRTVHHDVAVDVQSDTPRRGCVHFPLPTSPCNGAFDVNTDNAKRDPGSDAFVATLHLDAENAGVPGHGEPKRFHVFVRDWNGTTAGVWEANVVEDASEYELRILDGQTREVLVLAEDRVGNLECWPACDALADESVQRDADVDPWNNETERVADALETKLELPGDSSVSANFTTDFVEPFVQNPRFVVGGTTWDFAGLRPRVGGLSDLQLLYEITEDAGQPEAVVRWNSMEGNASRTYTSPDTSLQVDLSEGSTHIVTWNGWSDLVMDPETWPEGLVEVTVDAKDLRGNTAKAFQAEVILDRTAPVLTPTEAEPVRVDYPDGQFHVDPGAQDPEDRNVTIRVSVEDPNIRGFTSAPHNLRLEVDASEVVADGAVAGGCVLQFSADEGCFSPQSGFWRTTVPIDPDFGDDLRHVRLNITVTDVAGNTNTTIFAKIVVGAPGLAPLRETHKVSVYNATLAWSTARDAQAYVRYGLSADELGEPVHSLDADGDRINGTRHEITLTGLDPGTGYVYQFFAVDPATGALEAGGLTFFATLHGVGMALGSPDPVANRTQVLSGLYRINGTAWVQSAIDNNLTVEPRVTLRLREPGLPDIGRVVFDGFTQDGNFTMDLVTDALQDGVHALEATASYLGEEDTATVVDLLVDNTAPRLRFVEPADQAILRHPPERFLVRAEEALTDVNVSSVRLRVDGIDAPDASAAFTHDGDAANGVLEITGLPDVDPGIHRIEVFAEDGGGNPGYASIRVLYDPEAPATDVWVVYPAGQEAARPGQWVTILVDVADGGGVDTVEADTTALGGAPGVALARDGGQHVLEMRIPADQAEGAHTVPVISRDAAGNVLGAAVDIEVDATAPGAPEVGLAILAANASAVQVNASEPVAVVVEAASEGLETVRAASEGLAMLHVLDLQGLQAGASYDVTVRLRDRAGHEASADQTWAFLPEIGRAPPVGNLTASAEPGAVQLSWDDVGAGFRYAVHRAQNGSFGTAAIANSALHVDNDVEPGASYSYFVQALDPQGRHGDPSGVVQVRVPAAPAEDDAGGPTISVHPSTGVAGQTEFVFTAVLRGASEDDPAAWLVLDGESRRMTKDPGEDCRESCTFRHATRLLETDMLDPSIGYHVEVYDASGATRLPATGSLDGPTVVALDDAVESAADQEAPGLPIPLILPALVGAILLVRRRNSL